MKEKFSFPLWFWAAFAGVGLVAAGMWVFFIWVVVKLLQHFGVLG